MSDIMRIKLQTFKLLKFQHKIAEDILNGIGASEMLASGPFKLLNPPLECVLYKIESSLLFLWNPSIRAKKNWIKVFFEITIIIIICAYSFGWLWNSQHCGINQFQLSIL